MTCCDACGSPLWTRKLCLRCYQRYLHLRNTAAHLVTLAIRRRALPHPAGLGCVDCGKRASQYDHRDYKQPLTVDSVCQSCNQKRGAATQTWENLDAFLKYKSPTMTESTQSNIGDESSRQQDCLK